MKNWYVHHLCAGSIYIISVSHIMKTFVLGISSILKLGDSIIKKQKMISLDDNDFFLS